MLKDYSASNAHLALVYKITKSIWFHVTLFMQFEKKKKKLFYHKKQNLTN